MRLTYITAYHYNMTNNKITYTSNIYNDGIVNRVRDELFKASIYKGQDVLRKAVEVIHSTLECVECSLWTINHNSTRNGSDGKEFVSTSVICRKDTTGFIFTENKSFVHELKGTLFEAVVNQTENHDPYYIYHKEDPCFSLHTTQAFVKFANLQELVILPICNNNGTVVALLNLSYSENRIDENVWEVLSEIIRSFFDFTFERHIDVNKQRLMNSLISAHGLFRNEKVEVLFNQIKKIIGLFCPSQGASFFMWDNYQNRYRMVATTGLKPHEDRDPYYLKGEGLTGWMGTHPKPFISDNITSETSGSPIGKYSEIMSEKAQTAIFIPIISPSTKDNVIGVFRLINKKNACNNDVIDYFNGVDADWMSYAAEYLALVVDRYQREDEQTAFISKLAHEFKTPANAIYKSADRLKEHINEPSFLDKYLPSYLDNIIDFSQLQTWQANATLYLARNRKTNYNNRRCSLFNVLMKSRDVVRPIARDFNLKFNKIVITPVDSNLCLKIDEEAFIIVFQNLLTNAIKYCDHQDPDSFFVIISSFVSGGVVKIIIQDSGIGIEREEKETIFQVGFRGTNAIKKNGSGFGVGLPVVKQIIEDYGGTISVESCKNPTTFVITLPNGLII